MCPNPYLSLSPNRNNKLPPLIRYCYGTVTLLHQRVTIILIFLNSSGVYTAPSNLVLLFKHNINIIPSHEPIYTSMWREAIDSKLSYSLTQVPRLQPGFKPPCKTLSNPNTNPMHLTARPCSGLKPPTSSIHDQLSFTPTYNDKTWKQQLGNHSKRMRLFLIYHVEHFCNYIVPSMLCCTSCLMYIQHAR